MPSRYFRYRLPDKAPQGEELVYFPYWRFKGMIFSYLSTGIQHRFLDTSRQAVTSPFFPISVGLRSQAMKLRFVSPDAKGWFIKPATPFKQVMDAFLERINRDLPGPVYHQAHIGESLSLIYAPFYVGKTVMDAVLNQPVSQQLDESFDLNQFPGGPADWKIGFLPTLCPNCGWDMEGSRDALALHCKNCESAWQASKEGMTLLNVAHLPGQKNGAAVYLPFWRIRSDVSGLDLGSYADLVKVANLPKVAQPGWDRVPFYFWGPAFKVRPRSFLRLTQQMTLSQPRDKLVARVPKDAMMHPVNLPVSESAESLKLNLAGFMRPKSAVPDSISKIHIRARRYLLVYIPFEVRHHDLVQPQFKIAVNRNQLALAGNL
ncbi:hypothetical protein DSCW_09370 [Desulfosarcina widdelii]|uniref:Uncharacterized protein n=1 Tax=Desulfosarcina widdelii TaxID=947919 RepID=A0A5K7YYR3_9BACT|nr:hypothetical protein [Desulfosarcina widdelii]BBO73520.1 hypothetical protein DSCW_09370 [Desulfosarcina widdelii]